MTTEQAPTQSTALVIGESLIDIVSRPEQTPVEHPGGSPMNVAIGLARLGRRVELATWYGSDEHGRLIDDHLAADGVIVSEGSRQASSTSTAIAHVAADGSAEYVFDLDWSLPSVSVPPNCPVVHVGSLGTSIDPGAEVVRHAVEDVRGAATISYDPNIRPDLQPDPAAARAIAERFVRLADVVKASDEDLAYIGEGADPEEVLAGWLDLGPKLVVMTASAGDVVALTASGLGVRTSAKKVEVADTVGAGDSFTAGLIDGLWTAGLLGADNRDALRRIDSRTLDAILDRCTTIAGITVSRAGANPPRLDELV
ncbi:carbohydrate kinase family protein [Acidipropionibacterium jensenii]|uniref:carbohydrate kinase family protein n=1 Tax=Acidipropionibacterium jensenii TaxID=1749 RepID=UPI00110BEA27|nr:carbohydrate kinase [Acidipropionibacterium jensenii]MDN5976615.1 carbohydrate kinase [Acidipropionibacterium jensenii]MDN5996437.1 carbohydrate kinase [Acidipropionibacterium jensenii]MDN6427577.1 carbohydrate kinase [Acidipropionibacterium jensenii]MDN6441649.1 carbohydrate kinase [Acidipropionibacterium jensenii]MDN6480933.1 carbohydrate kinase [Acidipropionibacterium jensenii]